MGNAPPQPQPVEGRHRGLDRDLVDDLPTDAFPPIGAPLAASPPARAGPGKGRGARRPEPTSAQPQPHGPSARTSTAVLGTLVSLLLIGELSAAFTALARLTGLDETTSALIGALGTGVDARGLLLAGVLIGALGVLDDVTVTQTSAVWELHGANPTLGARGLFTAAMRIGRDHVSSAVNTLVLGDVVTTEEVATEIVRTLVGRIGLVASVPITTAVAAVVASQESD